MYYDQRVSCYRRVYFRHLSLDLSQSHNPNSIHHAKSVTSKVFLYLFGDRKWSHYNRDSFSPSRRDLGHFGRPCNEKRERKACLTIVSPLGNGHFFQSLILGSIKIGLLRILSNEAKKVQSFAPSNF